MYKTDFLSSWGFQSDRQDTYCASNYRFDGYYEEKFTRLGEYMRRPNFTVQRIDVVQVSSIFWLTDARGRGRNGQPLFFVVLSIAEICLKVTGTLCSGDIGIE